MSLAHSLLRNDITRFLIIRLVGYSVMKNPKTHKLIHRVVYISVVHNDVKG